MGSGNIFVSGWAFQTDLTAGGSTVVFSLPSTSTFTQCCWIQLRKVRTGHTILISPPQAVAVKKIQLIQSKDQSGTQSFSQHFFREEGIAKASLPACFCHLISICDLSEPHLQLCFPEWSHKWTWFECFVTSILLEGMGLFISQETNRS